LPSGSKPTTPTQALALEDGLTGGRVIRSVDDPNEVVLIFEAPGHRFTLALVFAAYHRCWRVHLLVVACSYRLLNGAKYKVIGALEERLNISVAIYALDLLRSRRRPVTSSRA
jgi:hypothetical protein